MVMGSKVLVFGANSAICHELLKVYAKEGANYFLVGRNQTNLTAVADDLQARGGLIKGVASYDFNEWQQHQTCVLRARDALGSFDIVIVAHGSLPDQPQCETDASAVKACMDDNFTSAAIIIQACAQQLSLQGYGTLAVLSSVAGDRGRKSNYVYGAAKAGIDALLQGLQGRFSGSGVKVVNIKPGMIATPMTASMKHGPIWSTPEAIAPVLHKAIASGRPVCYAPSYWRLIMLIIRTLPTAILAKLPI